MGPEVNVSLIVGKMKPSQNKPKQNHWDMPSQRLGGIRERAPDCRLQNETLGVLILLCYLLCDFEQVTSSLCVSVSLSRKWE